MDKVIDGVDVSECEYFQRNRGFHCYKGKGCTETNDCYYKQLKRKEQEYEKLKEEVADLNFYIDNYRLVWEIGKYKQTMQEIREIVEGCQYGDCQECKYKPADDCRTQLIVNVIAKINEVKGAEE